MGLVRHAQTPLRVDRLQAHQTHQTTHTFGVDLHPLRRQHAVQVQPHLLHAVERRPHVLLVDQPHQPLVERILAPRLVVQRAAMQPQQLALATDRDLLVSRFDHRSLLLSREVLTFF